MKKRQDMFRGNPAGRERENSFMRQCQQGCRNIQDTSNACDLYESSPIAIFDVVEQVKRANKTLNGKSDTAGRERVVFGSQILSDEQGEQRPGPGR
jgi:hypothetical protein